MLYRSQVWRNRVLWHLQLFSARLPVKVFKTLNGRQSHILSKFHKSKKFSRSELSWSISWSWSWSWSNQPVLWDFYIMFLLSRVQSMAWQATFDVITSWPFMPFHAASSENWREESRRVSSLLEPSLFHHNVDKIMLKCISAPEGN